MRLGKAIADEAASLWTNGTALVRSRLRWDLDPTTHPLQTLGPSLQAASGRARLWGNATHTATRSTTASTNADSTESQSALELDPQPDGRVDVLRLLVAAGHAAINVRQRDAGVEIDPLQWAIVDHEGDRVEGARAGAAARVNARPGAGGAQSHAVLYGGIVIVLFGIVERADDIEVRPHGVFGADPEHVLDLVECIGRRGDPDGWEGLVVKNVGRNIVAADGPEAIGVVVRRIGLPPEFVAGEESDGVPFVFRRDDRAEIVRQRRLEVVGRIIFRDRRRERRRDDAVGRPTDHAVQREIAEIRADPALEHRRHAVALIVAADLGQAGHPKIVGRAPVLDRGVAFRELRVAEAGVGAGEAERREGVSRPRRVIGGQHVERERIHPTGDQGPIVRMAEAEEALRIVPLPGPARIPVGALQVERPAVVHDLGTLRIGEIAGDRTEARLRGSDERPAAARRLGHFDADHRLADVIGRPEPFDAVALLADETLRAIAEGRIPGRAVGVVQDAGVERRVDGEAAIAQRTVGCGRVEPGPQACVTILGRLRRRRLRRRQVGGMRAGGERRHGQKRSAKSSAHLSPSSPKPRPGLAVKPPSGRQCLAPAMTLISVNAADALSSGWGGRVTGQSSAGSLKTAEIDMLSRTSLAAPNYPALPAAPT